MPWELRVTQTGVQLLTGFLLTLPFQQRFDLLDGQMRVINLITVGVTVVIFDAVSGTTAAVVAGCTALAVFTAFWLAVPLLTRSD